MPIVRFTSALKRFFPNLKPVEVEASSIPEILNQLNQQYPGIRDYLLTERGELRKHVNIYIGDSLIEDRTNLGDAVQDRDEILIFQALSGG